MNWQNQNIFDAFLPEMIDSAFIDRFNCYLPGWEIPKMKPQFFTSKYGFISDYLAEWFKEMRKKNYSDAVGKHFHYGHDLNQRDIIAVRKTVSGLLKLIYPHGEFTKAELKECLDYAVTTRRRVKEQLFRIAGQEFADVNLGYEDMESGEKYVVYPPEYR
ncbi:MAG: hypothetical protein IPG53_04895 [Ignavibacteriales bacterium]|nr:hypothetical protein [Ignavibacteriales bacterium]